MQVHPQTISTGGEHASDCNSEWRGTRNVKKSRHKQSQQQVKGTSSKTTNDQRRLRNARQHAHGVRHHKNTRNNLDTENGRALPEEACLASNIRAMAMAWLGVQVRLRWSVQIQEAFRMHALEKWIHGFRSVRDEQACDHLHTPAVHACRLCRCDPTAGTIFQNSGENRTGGFARQRRLRRATLLKKRLPKCLKVKEIVHSCGRQT